MSDDRPIFVMPDLKGPGGNAFVLLGQAASELKRAGCSEAKRKSFHDEATSGDYEHLLSTILTWFNVVVPKTEYVSINKMEELE